MGKRKPFLFTWRDTVLGQDGPPSPTTRYVLLTLAVFMDQAGGSCFPSIRTLVDRTGLVFSTVQKHLEIAVTAGWLTRSYHKSPGQGWRRYQYRATTPDNVIAEDDHLEGKGDRFDGDKVIVQEDTSTPVKPQRPPTRAHARAETLYDFYISKIKPAWKSKQGALKNIKTHLKKYSVADLEQAVSNYGSQLKQTRDATKYRKDPANFFGINEQHYIDFLSENFEPPEPEVKPEDFLMGDDIDKELERND